MKPYQNNVLLPFILLDVSLLWAGLLFFFGGPVWAGAGNQPLVDTIARVKPSIVGVGTVQKTRRPPSILRGTGFVVADGRHVITNAHVIP